MRAHVVTNEVTSGLRRNLLMTVALVITVMVSLLLVMLGLAVREQARLTKAFWYGNIEVTVALCNAGLAPSHGCAGGAGDPGPAGRDPASDLRALPEVAGRDLRQPAAGVPARAGASSRAQRSWPASPLTSSRSPTRSSSTTREVRRRRPRAIAGQPRASTTSRTRRDKLQAFFNVLRWMQIGSLAVAIVMLGVATLLIVNTHPALGVQPAPGDGDQAPRGRQQPVHPAALRAGGGRGDLASAGSRRRAGSPSSRRSSSGIGCPATCGSATGSAGAPRSASWASRSCSAWSWPPWRRSSACSATSASDLSHAR